MTDITRTGEKITLGRRDYGFGVTAEIVTVLGETFAERNGKFYTQCGNCDGGFSGSKMAFTHVYSAVCFQCNGRGFHKVFESAEQVIKIAKRRISDRARAERKRVERAAAQEAAVVEWRAANTVTAAAVDEVLADAPTAADDYDAYDAWNGKWGGFVTDIANKAQFKALTEKQADAFLTAFEEAKAAQIEATEVASKQRYLDVAVGAKGVTVTGTITVAASFESTNFNGFPETKRVVIVEGSGADEGVTVKMMGGAQALWDAERGQVVEVKGTVKEFSEYRGVPQTVFIRPKFKVLAEAVTE